MPMTYNAPQTCAWLSGSIGHHREELTALQRRDVCQAMETGVHANAETSDVAEALVRRMMCGAIKMAETLPDDEDEDEEVEDIEDIDEDEEDDEDIDEDEEDEEGDEEDER